MPLVRAQVRNVYKLGMPELYTEADREDPKALLEGVAVAGLVGLLRQLGDLAEFAAEVFHGLQEQMLVTSSRSHKLVVRVHKIEDALPPIEKAILAQKSHLHFAYTSGSHWHARVRSVQNHFIYGDLPRCIMDNYEECRDPPRLHLLDRFDTGGPGSCLKRYSDPTFFRRASYGFDEAHIRSVGREKKARKRKKKRTWPGSREVLQGVSSSALDDRLQFASRDMSQKASPFQDGPAFDVSLKSEMENHSPSFDSRNGSAYIECIFHPSISTQSEENEPSELFDSDLKMHHRDSLDSFSIEDQHGAADNNFQRELLKEHNTPSPSSVSFDEKIKIVEPTEQPKEIPGKLCATIDVARKEGGTVDLRAIDQMDFEFDEQIQTSVSGGDHLDDIESEADCFVDALNTIESESDNELDCQTKREMLQDSNVKNKAADERILAAQKLDGHSIIFESHVPASTPSETVPELICNSIIPVSHIEAYSSSNNGISEDKTKSISSASIVDCDLPQMDIIPSTPCKTEETFITENDNAFDDANIEAVSSNILSPGSRESNLQNSLSGEILSSYGAAPKPPSVSSAVQPIMFWTNGGLLGLEPSKPPDFRVLNAAAGQDSVATENDREIEPSNQDSILEDSGHVARPGTVFQSSKSEWSTDPHHCTIDALWHDINFSNTMTPGPKGPDDKDDNTRPMKENVISSSRIFEFSNRLLVNGFRKQLSLVGDEKLASLVNTDVSNKTNTLRAYPEGYFGKTFAEQFGRVSPIMSPTSPPLEHMKITFQPIGGFETSKLKLNFPNGSNCPESRGDMFPSFQLVPEPAISLHESALDSDDDTFCRSSPYMSDDCYSHNSESNSEKWESDESPNKGNELNDAISGFSSTENGIRNQVGFPDNCGLQSPYAESEVRAAHSNNLLDLPNYDTLESSIDEVFRISNGKHSLESCSPKEPTSPPLPPMQWRGMKPHPDVAMEKDDVLPEALTRALNLNLPAPSVSQQPKPAPLKNDDFVKTTEHTPKSKQDWQKRDGQKNSVWTTKGKMIDNEDDFLQQIRKKSLNLRRTATSQQNFAPAGLNNVKVAAILEKANAIRQALGNVDGEDDDTWSDN